MGRSIAFIQSSLYADFENKLQQKSMDLLVSS